MPELLEVELYRRLVDDVLPRTVSGVEVVDPHCLGPATTTQGLRAALVGTALLSARRRGKLLLLDAPEHTLGIRFGMTGGVVVDDVAAIDRLLYSSARTGERWVRFRLAFADGGGLALHDPRRFGRVILDPDEEVLGPDALAVTEGELARALASPRPGGGPPLKARLLDQHKLAGIGNLLADEILWRADLSPRRPSASLTPAELRRLHRQLRRTLKQLLARGGSHLGDLMEHRRVGGRCPRDGAELQRGTVGGRTTWWCPVHQR